MGYQHPNEVAVRWDLEGREAGGRPSPIPPPLIYDAFDGYIWGASVSELFQMAWLVEGVSLPPQGRIYSSCRLALTVPGKSRTGAASLSAEQPAPPGPGSAHATQSCKPGQLLRDTPCPSSSPCRFALSPLLQHSRLAVNGFLLSVSGACESWSQNCATRQGKKILNHNLLIMCHSYV